MRAFAGQGRTAEPHQQEEENPFAVVTEQDTEQESGSPFQVLPEKSTDRVEQLLKKQQATSSQDRNSNEAMNTRPRGINDNLVIHGELPSGGPGLPALYNNTDPSNPTDSSPSETATVVQKEAETSKPADEMNLFDMHWGIWLAIAIPATVVFTWVSRRLIRMQRRAVRTRTKEDTIAPITNRLRDVGDLEEISESQEQGEFANSKSQTKAKRKSRGQETETKSYGEIARNNAQLALAAVTSSDHELGGSSKPDDFGLYADGASDLDPKRYKTMLLNQVDELFNGAAKEGDYDVSDDERRKKMDMEALLAGHVQALNARIEKLEAEHTHVSSAKSSPENRSQLKAIQDELVRWQDTANALRTQLASLSQHASESDQRIHELQETNKLLHDELAADRTALIALNQLLESKEAEIQKLSGKQNKDS